MLGMRKKSLLQNSQNCTMLREMSLIITQYPIMILVLVPIVYKKRDFSGIMVCNILK